MSSIQSESTSGADVIYSKPLSINQIRILALQQGAGNERLSCQLRIVDITDKSVSYEAISYVWGSSNTPDVISCRSETDENDDKEIELSINRNAADALRAVRKPQGERLVWIDSICISQACSDEKSAQVALMDSIFARATAVLVWLGRHDDVLSTTARGLLVRWADWLRSTTLEDRLWMYSPFSSFTAHDEGLDHDEVEVLLSVFENEWFWRLWCVQELVMAREVIVYWGSITVPWEAISGVAAQMKELWSVRVAESGLAGVQNALMLEHLRSQIKGKAERRLTWLDRRICNSPDADGKLKEPLITPDYSSRLEDIYLLTARRLLIREGNLHLLSFVQHDTEVGAGSLPSWVPQWHINKHRLITQFDLLSGHPVKVAQEATWAKKTVSSKHLTDGLWNSEKPLDVIDDGTLRAQGLLLTTVSEKCADVAFTTDCGSGWIQALRQWLQRVLIWSENNAQQDGRDVSQLQLHDIVFRVFYRVLFGGHLRIKDVFNQLRREINVFRDLLYSVSAEAANLCPTTRRLVIQMCRSRTLFLTIEGQVGIGPQCLQPGDSVCLLSGAAVPLLMRQDPGALARWLLVGETYVNGLAHVSNDYEAAEDFEALHNGAALDELRSSLANSGIRIQSDPTRLPRSCGMSKSYLWSNEFDPLEELSEQEISEIYVESTASGPRAGELEMEEIDFGEPIVFLIN